VDLALSVLPVHVPQEDPADIWELPEVSELEALSALAEVHEERPEVSELEVLSALAEVHEERPVVLSELEPVRLAQV
jgi:hypothetical protein